MTSFPHSIDIIPGALLFSVSDEMSVDTTRRIAECVSQIDALHHAGIKEIIPSYGSILVIYDEIVYKIDDIILILSDMWKHTLRSRNETNGDIVTVDVVYGDTYGDDLANVSEITGKSVDEVITLHAKTSYTVGAVGFSPGFTYLIGLPPELSVPRRSIPRLNVPSGSVGIGGNQTGIYALPSAGGWNLIGRSPTRLFNPDIDPPVRLKLGDMVQFRQIDTAEFPDESIATSTPRGNGPIEVLMPGMQSTIQDLGRYGMGRYGFATDGAADRASLVEANRLAGNLPGHCALEIAVQGPSLRFHHRHRFGLAGANLGARLNGRPLKPGRGFETMPGDELVFLPSAESSGARAYLAVEGGFDIPLVMGSASTNLTAGIGGWYGRALVQGDRLSVGQTHVPTHMFTPGMQRRTDPGDHTPFRVLPGPQRSRFDDSTWDCLLQREFTISDDANRVGLRLLGPSLAPADGADILSEGLVTGSIQVTGEGQAIVMLPGHATIGGYTRLATVISQDWDRLGQLTPGDVVRFCEVD